MKTKSILLFILSLTFGSISAQDVIINNTGDEIQAKVLEISSSEIKYKRYDNLDGPIITIAKSEVLLIKYENGTKDVFQNQAEESSSAATETSQQN
ncbi:MAG TPA: hypothetical protein DCR48_05710, partial [Flavobacteriales bacterium]|nr:hypothetical protein [Flavobacteriales bacterium]